MLSFADLTTIYPDQIWLALSPAEQDAAWQQAERYPYSSLAARERAYHNLLCLHGVSRFLAEEFDLPQAPTPWVTAAESASFWNELNGSILTVGSLRLMLVPSDALSVSELRVEREWVESPGLATPYYLAIQVCLQEREDSWLRIVGYATHAEILRSAAIDRMDRSYCLSQTHLIQDLTILWTAGQLVPDRQPVTPSLPILEPIAVETRIAQLSPSHVTCPRLAVPPAAWEEWLSLIADDTYRQQLYQQRLEQQRLVGLAASSEQPLTQQPLTQQPQTAQKVTLSRWFQERFEAGWEVASSMLFPPSYAVAKGTSPSVSSIARMGKFDLGNHVVLLTLQLHGSPLARSVSDGSVTESDSEIAIQLDVRLQPSHVPLPGDLVVALDYQDEELGEFERIEEILPATASQSVLRLPQLLGTLGDTFQVTLQLGDCQSQIQIEV